MTALARWCFQHRKRVLGLWLFALVVTVALSQNLGSDFNSDFTLRARTPTPQSVC